MPKKTANVDPRQMMRALALRYPEAEEGVACAGTVLESRAFKARNKTFLFVGPADAKLKLRESQAEATAWAAQEPGRCKVGAAGWVTVDLRSAKPLPLPVLQRWIDESYRVVVDKKLVALLPDPSSTLRGKSSNL